jgi:microcompartment protein CcmL/EutN
LSERDPAIAIFEFGSISAGDARVTAAPLGVIYAGTVHPGKDLVLVGGDTASVEEAVEVGTAVASEALIDMVFLPDVHPSVAAAVTGNTRRASVGEEALGVIETISVAAAIDAADAGVKAADVDLAAIRLGDGLGGKGYVLFSGVVGGVEAALEAAAARAESHGALVRSDLIAQLHDEMAENMRADLHFLKRVSAAGDG